ncbi:unnamed protein product, partial [Symbiodinium sp. CCMP2592]
MEVRAESSGLARTLGSAYALHEGLLPQGSVPGGGLAGSVVVPIPVYSRPKSEDFILRGYTMCSSQERSFENWYSSEQFRNKAEETVELRSRVASALGRTNVTEDDGTGAPLPDWWNTYDELVIAAQAGSPVVNSSDMEEAEELAAWLEAMKFSKKVAGNRCGGPLLHVIGERLDSSKYPELSCAVQEDGCGISADASDKMHDSCLIELEHGRQCDSLDSFSSIQTRKYQKPMELSNLSTSMLAEDAGELTSMSIFLRNLALRYATTDFSVSQCTNGTDPISTAELCQAAASVLGLTFRKPGFLDGRAPGCVVSRNSDVWFNLASGGANSDKLGLICEIKQPCTATAPKLSSVYPCTCGSATCQPGQLCSSNGCEDVPCSVTNGSATSDSYPCMCGNVTCGDGQICTSSVNDCLTFALMDYGLSDCGPFDSVLTVSQCEAAALNLNLTYRASDNTDGTAQGCIASASGDAWFNSVSGGVNNASYALICSTRQAPSVGPVPASELADFEPPTTTTSDMSAPTSTTAGVISSTQLPISTTSAPTPSTSTQSAPAAWEFVTSGSCSDPVTSLAECATALESLVPGAGPPVADNLPVNSSASLTRPTGCYYRAKGNHRGFDVTGTNEGLCGSGGWNCLCRQTSLMMMQFVPSMGRNIDMMPFCDWERGWQTMTDPYKCQVAVQSGEIPFSGGRWRGITWRVSKFGCIRYGDYPGERFIFNTRKHQPGEYFRDVAEICEKREACECTNGANPRYQYWPCIEGANCASCNHGYYLTSGTCQEQVCTCENGSAERGLGCPSNGAAKCRDCNSGYYLAGGSCIAHTCLCQRGVAARGATSCPSGGWVCASCDAGFHLNGVHCIVNRCTCANGQAAQGAACYASGNICTSCNPGYVLAHGVCQPCRDFRPNYYDFWFDGAGNTCAWYGEVNGRCSSFGSSVNHGQSSFQACCSCGGGSLECIARFVDDKPLEGTEFREVTLTGPTSELDARCCNLCKDNFNCEYWFRDLDETGEVKCRLGHSATLRKRRDGPNYRGGYKGCSVQDGSGASSAYPCTCGGATCYKGQKCFGSDSYCAGPFMTLNAYRYPITTPCASPVLPISSMAECESAAAALGLSAVSGPVLHVGGPVGCYQWSLDDATTSRWKGEATSGVWPFAYFHICTNPQLLGTFPSAFPRASSNSLAPPGAGFSFVGVPWLPLQPDKVSKWPGTCIRTNVEQSWYQVDFQNVYRFSSVSLLSRDDCCEDELQNLDILVATAGFSSYTVCARGVGVLERGVTQNIPCEGTGSIIQIQHSSTKALSLCGFSAFGVPVGSFVQIQQPEPGVDGDLILPANGSQQLLNNSEAVPAVSPQTVDTIIISGHCDSTVNGVYAGFGTTTSGMPFYSDEDGYHLYYDPDCDGLGTPPKWIIGSTLPNTTRFSDLDEDGACDFVAAIPSRTMNPLSRPPTGELSWRLLCDGSFDDRSMKLENGDTLSWQNNFGLSCETYISRGWCSNGGFTAGFEWTGKEAYLDQSTVPQDCQESILFQQAGNCAEFYNYPGRNCAACGKSAAEANCSIVDGSTSSSSYPCQCGNATCASGQVCMSSSSTCQDGQFEPTLVSGYISMALANCTAFMAEPNASHAIAEGVGKHLRLPVSWISVQLTCGVLLLEGEQGSSQDLQGALQISIPPANASVYDPTTIANNVVNVDRDALAMEISSAIA